MAARWSWSIGPWTAGVSAHPTLAQGGPQTDLGSASRRSLKLKLRDPSEAEFVISGYSTQALVVEELITDLWVYRNGESMGRYRCGAGPQPTADDIDESGRYTLTVSCTDYRGVLERRLRWTDRTWTDVEQSTIAWDAISDAQAELGGDYGITKGSWPATGLVRPLVTIKAGDFVGAFIKKLGAMDGGFDWDIDEKLRANLWSPRRGSDPGATLDWGGAVTKIRRTFDPSRYANAIRQSGADSVATTTQSVADIATTREGRWDAQYGDPQLTTADMVAQTAAANLTQASQLLPTYALTLATGAWGGRSHVWLGDMVRIPVKAGRLNEQPWARVYEIDIDLDDSDEETVTVVAGDVRMDARSVLRGIAQRLTAMAKR